MHQRDVPPELSLWELQPELRTRRGLRECLRGRSMRLPLRGQLRRELPWRWLQSRVRTRCRLHRYLSGGCLQLRVHRRVHVRHELRWRWLHHDVRRHGRLHIHLLRWRVHLRLCRWRKLLWNLYGRRLLRQRLRWLTRPARGRRSVPGRATGGWGSQRSCSSRFSVTGIAGLGPLGSCDIR